MRFKRLQTWLRISCFLVTYLRWIVCSFDWVLDRFFVYLDRPAFLLVRSCLGYLALQTLDPRVLVSFDFETDGNSVVENELMARTHIKVDADVAERLRGGFNRLVFEG